MLSAVAMMTVGASIVFGLIDSTPRRVQGQAQDKSAHGPVLEYEVASIKRFIPVGFTNLSGVIPFAETPDGLVARLVTAKMLILRAYAVDNYQLSGAADWISSERYDIDAKFDGSTADELQKLSPDDRILARRQMLQKLLAERLNLTIHRENKELQVYALVVGKNGPKLQEVKVDDADSDKSKGSPASGRASMVGGPAPVMKGQASPLSNLTGMLTAYLHRLVIDSTGLTGRYDFTLHWTADDNRPQPSSNVQGASADSPSTLPSSDPTGGASLFTAIQEQLGLKLESAKGPVEFIVIDHVERPSGN